MAKSTEKLRHLEESYRYWYITSINDAQYSVHAIGEKKLPTTTWYLVLQYDTYSENTDLTIKNTPTVRVSDSQPLLCYTTRCTFLEFTIGLNDVTNNSCVAIFIVGCCSVSD